MLDGMRALIVYESMFGSTRDIARAIADGLRPATPVDVVGVDDAPGTLGAVGADASLLIVGAPTHPFGLSRPRSRVAAAGRAATLPTATTDHGLREWLDALPRASGQRDALAFETRLRVRGWPGSAAKAAAKRLRKAGYRLLWPAQTFYVADLTGTLVEGEIQRARMWGRWLGAGAPKRETQR
jgi:flavorubredoxin